MSQTDKPRTQIGQLNGTNPLTDPKSKRVMLHGERKDPVIIADIISDINESPSVPLRFQIIQRTETYFGPRLLLMSEDGINYKMTAPGPDRQLLLWKAKTDDNGFCENWEAVAEVKAQFGDDLPSYEFCPHCGKPIKSVKHERIALFGQCSGNWN